MIATKRKCALKGTFKVTLKLMFKGTLKVVYLVALWGGLKSKKTKYLRIQARMQSFEKKISEC